MSTNNSSGDIITSRAGWQRYCCTKASRRKCSERSANLLFNGHMEGGLFVWDSLSPPSVQWIRVSFSPGVQRPDCDADDTLAFSAKVTNLGDILVLPLIHTCMPLWRNLHRNFEVTKHAINSYAIIELRMKVTNRWEGEKCSQTTQLIRKMLYSNMKLHVSAYNGHRQVSIPIKGSLYIWVGGLMYINTPPLRYIDSP